MTSWRRVIPLLLLSAAAHPASPQTSAQTQAPDPLAVSLNEWLLTFDPSAVSAPLDWTGLSSMRLPLFSQRTFSWTDVRYSLDGFDATDPYQPGRMLAFPDAQAIREVTVRQGLELGATPAYGSEIVIGLREPEKQRHGEISSSGTGSPLASDNLPTPATRGDLQQSERFHWFTRNHAQVTGPLSRHADALLSASGQWASQSIPPATPGQDLNSRVLSLDARARYQLDAKDQVSAAFGGSQVRLADWGAPAGIEALAGLPSVPLFSSPYGFSGLRETDRFTRAQVSWSRQAFEARYGYSKGQLDTRPTSQPPQPPQIDLATGTFSGPPPLANLGDRSRHSLTGAFTPGEFVFAGLRHHVATGAEWAAATMRNRFSAPFNEEAVAINGVTAYRIVLNTPTDSKQRTQNLAPYVRDQITIASWLTADVALTGDIARGSDLIAWNSASPRAGLALSPPVLRAVTLRASYVRLDSPLAGRYLDFGNPASLGGSAYEDNLLLARFGGPYSSIDPHLKRPYADEFNVGAEARLPHETNASIRLFRRDEKNRIAAIDTGVPPASYQPVRILDPGPDAITGTFDDQMLTVYAQDPATLGKNRYLLTNPTGLRMLNEGMVAEARGAWRWLQGHTSFMAVKSWGPQNPGDSALTNDPGVIGALLANPNTAIHAAGRSYFDRAYVGKAQLVARLPNRFGGIECVNTAIYMDGLPFARQLLVTGLPQGPLLVAATVRGSPEGGNRAEYTLDWNLRLGRAFATPHGNLRVGLDILNVTNAANRVQESDLSGPNFNQRLPLAIEPARFLRFDIQFRF